MSDHSVGSNSSSDDEDLLNYQPFASSQEDPKQQQHHAEVTPPNSLEVQTQDPNHNDNNNDEAFHEALAEKKVNVMLMPYHLEKITPSELFWIKIRQIYHPCRLGKKEETFGLDLEQDYDESKKSLIQMIVFPGGLGERMIVQKRRLIPYCGNKTNNDDSDEKNEWCKTRCQQYIKCLKKRNPSRYKTVRGSLDVMLKAELIWLKRILDHAKKYSQTLLLSETTNQEGNDSEEHLESGLVEIFPNEDVDGDDNHSELDEPYTQDWGNPTSDTEEDDPYASAVTLAPSRKKEPIRPGDVISYHSHVYVSGDKRGLRTATVLSVNAKGDPILKLSNGECLPKNTQIKRVKIMVRGTLVDHKGIYRPIDFFKLKTDLNSNINVETEAQRVGKIVHTNLKKLKETIEKEGGQSLPVDFVNKYSKNSSSSTTTTATTNTKKRRESLPGPRKYPTPSSATKKRRRSYEPQPKMTLKATTHMDPLAEGLEESSPGSGSLSTPSSTYSSYYTRRKYNKSHANSNRQISANSQKDQKKNNKSDGATDPVSRGKSMSFIPTIKTFTRAERLQRRKSVSVQSTPSSSQKSKASESDIMTPDSANTTSDIRRSGRKRRETTHEFFVN